MPCCPSPHWQLKSLLTPAGLVSRVRTDLQFADRLGAVKARLGINRMNYKIAPGLYAVGNPTKDSPVLVSANYKMSFDHLRSSMPGRDAWIMGLDTRGLPLWATVTGMPRASAIPLRKPSSGISISGSIGRG